MQGSMVGGSRQSIAWRLVSGALALVMLLGLGACKASGGGRIGEPLDGGPVSVFEGQAHFGFNYSCDITEDRVRITGHIIYHDDPSVVGGVEFPEIRLHGTVDPVPVEGVASCVEAAELYEGLPAAQFEGTYRSQGDTEEPGRFTVLVFDQREPGGSIADVTGDGFAIALTGGAYGGYTRAGYLESGNIQVK
jgi:hypothetical protein